MDQTSNTGSNSLQANMVALHPFQGILLCLLSSLATEYIFEQFLLIEPLLFNSIGRVLIVFLSLYTIHRFSLVSLVRYRPTLKDLTFLHIVLILTLFILLLWRVFSLALCAYGHGHILSQIRPESLYFAFPFAIGGILIQAVRGLSYSMVFAVSLTIILGIYSPGEAIIIPFAFISTVIASMSLARFRSRAAYYRAGFNVAIIALPFALASCIMTPNLVPTDIAVRILSALLGGVFCTFLAAGFIPLVEALGGYVTDMRLIEMSTLDHPLLKELSVQAPGTWNHSMVIGMMVEAAADATGANPVLARVGAYFHDIGKMKKPVYFVENQGGDNRHDRLSSSMSSLIIRSHVKDGIDLARKYRLPETIINLIPEHHGTSRIEYFYQKALKEAEEAGEDPNEVDVSVYSYPGPKPQTREGALLMLADSIEPASRTLSEPTRDRIQGMVQKMINKIFSSGQLDECDLTLRDLHQIAKSFTRTLTAIYHQRIAYAEPAEKGGDSDNRSERNGGNEIESETDEKESNLDSGDTKQTPQTNRERDEGSEDSGENLKRLGIDDNS